MTIAELTLVKMFLKGEFDSEVIRAVVLFQNFIPVLRDWVDEANAILSAQPTRDLFAARFMIPDECTTLLPLEPLPLEDLADGTTPGLN